MTKSNDLDIEATAAKCQATPDEMKLAKLALMSTTRNGKHSKDVTAAMTSLFFTMMLISRATGKPDTHLAELLEEFAEHIRGCCAAHGEVQMNQETQH